MRGRISIAWRGGLYRRIRADCYHPAIANAVGKVNNPRVTAVHTGRPPAMTALLVETPESAVGTSSGSGSL